MIHTEGMRNTVVFLIVLCTLIPAVSAAQSATELQAKINALLEQIQTLQNKISGSSAPVSSAAATVGCPALGRTLGIGSRGNDVIELQIFLKAKGYFNEEATGYFGALTEAAIKKIQATNSIVSSGTAAATGYGAVGPKTRAVIATLCGAGISASPGTVTLTATPAEQCAQVTSASKPATSCSGTWEKLMNGPCQIGWRCALPTSGANKPAVISGIDGPGTLAVNSFGSWKINALDPEGGPLSYRVTWGDEGVESLLSAIAGLGGSYVSSPNFTHSFNKAGTFSVEAAVKDGAGNVTPASWSVRVGATPSGTAVGTYTNPIASTGVGTGISCATPWGSQIVVSSSTVAWQPFFTEGAYFATTSPVMRCDNGAWKKCDTVGANCQDYTHATSTPSTAALPSYTTTIGGKCAPEGSSREVAVPPGTQLCQWLNCRITTQVEKIVLKCTDSGWTDYAKY